MTPECVLWLPDGTPRSSRFDDIYRARSNALTQSRAVFLAGCALPGRWRERDQFTVLETGFGLGLNFLLTWATWLADPQRCHTLNFVSVESLSRAMWSPCCSIGRACRPSATGCKR